MKAIQVLTRIDCPSDCGEDDLIGICWPNERRDQRYGRHVCPDCRPLIEALQIAAFGESVFQPYASTSMTSSPDPTEHGIARGISPSSGGDIRAAGVHPSASRHAGGPTVKGDHAMPDPRTPDEALAAPLGRLERIEAGL